MTTEKAIEPGDLPIDTIRQAIVPANRKQIIDHPGFINIAMKDGGHYPGCKLIEFVGVTGPDPTFNKSAVDKANEFFTDHANLVIVEWKLHDSSVYVLYTNQLTDKEIEVLNESSTLFREAVEKKMAQQVSDEEEAEKAEKARIEELNQLAADGRKWRAHSHALTKLMATKGISQEAVEKELRKLLQGPDQSKPVSLAENLAKKGKK